MMRPDTLALARRAVAAKGRRWMRGMVGMLSDGAPVVCVAVEPPHGGPVLERVMQDYDLVRTRRCTYIDAVGVVPDLSHPATLGCILALVREAYGDPRAVVCAPNDEEPGWAVVGGEVGMLRAILGLGDTEAEALVAALEASP